MPCNFQNPYHTTSTFYKRLLMYTPCVKQLIRALRMFARRISSYSLVGGRCVTSGQIRTILYVDCL